MAGERARYLLRLEVAKAIREAVAAGFKGMGNQLEAFTKGMDIGAKGDMEKVHKAIARDVREAVVDAYEQRVEAKSPFVYERVNRRSGYLGRMIRRHDLVQADALGISFIKEGTMDEEAAHWRRLNFGAGAAAGPQPGPYPIRLFGEAIINADLGGRPSPAFSLPKGFFIHGSKAMVPHSDFRGGETGNPFYLSRRSPYRPAVTAGIRGRHFLEEGLEVMSEQFPRRYSDLLNEWVQRGGRKARAVINTVTV